MKTLTAIFLSLIVYNSYACSCSKYPLPAGETLEHYLMSRYGLQAKLEEENVTWLKYYPTMYEKLFSSDFLNTSCGEEGPNGEPMFHCSNRDKSEYLIKFPDMNCESVVRITSTYTRIKIKEVKTNCQSSR